MGRFKIYHSKRFDKELAKYNQLVLGLLSRGYVLNLILDFSHLEEINDTQNKELEYLLKIIGIRHNAESSSKY